MEIKSSKTLVDESLKEIQTLDALKVKELFEQNKCHLIDIRDIRDDLDRIKQVIKIPEEE